MWGVQGAGLNKLRLLWFRTHEHGDGTMAGPLALVRSFEEDAEVYAVGSYRGNATRAKLRIERLGSDLLPTVQDDGCLGVVDIPCETTLQVYLPSRGALHPAVTVVLERVAFAQETEPGVQGDRVSGARKPATLETGLVLQVPLFVNPGDRIKVDTRTGDYITRA